MKKIIALVMAAMMVLGTSCGNKNKENTENNSNNTKVETGVDEEKETPKEENVDEKQDETAKEEEKEKINVTKAEADKLKEDGRYQYSETLKFEDNNKYKFEELKDSKEVEEEDGFEFEGDFYGDKYNAVNAIVKFNEAWLNYVNNNNQDVLSMVVKGSEAQHDIEVFNRNGLKEKFLLMEIGDVRKAEVDGVEYTYVWVHEKIEEDRSGDKKVRDYKWIYKMIKNEMDYKIVNFTRDTN